MATLSGTPAGTFVWKPGSRYDHVFFPGMAVVLTVTMVAGFAKSYFLAGVFRAKLPNVLIHIHGMVFTCWFLLLLIQPALVMWRRVDLHRKVGIAGVVLAGLMIPLGVLATAEYLAREAAEKWILMASIMPVAELFTFAVLATAAFLARKRPALHKRLILLATIGLIGAAVGRLEFLPYWHFHGVAALRLAWAYTYIFVIPLVAYDFWSMRKINRATLWGSVFLVSVHQVGLLACTTGPWYAFARWMQSWGV